jgi:hypothetical protein
MISFACEIFGVLVEFLRTSVRVALFFFFFARTVRFSCSSPWTAVVTFQPSLMSTLLSSVIVYALQLSLHALYWHVWRKHTCMRVHCGGSWFVEPRVGGQIPWTLKTASQEMVIPRWRLKRRRSTDNLYWSEFNWWLTLSTSVELTLTRNTYRLFRKYLPFPWRIS